MEAYANGSDRTPRRLIDYRQALEAQRRLVERRHAGEIEDSLWLLEHPPTVTWGSSGGERHLLASREELERRGFQVVASERGGDVTCHEPGQLVGYPILLLGPSDEERDLHRYLRLLEEAIIRLLGSLGLEAARVPGRTGVWLLGGGPPRKIAALGVRCSRWVTSHGFALNVENRLEGFRWIVPCGIRDAGVTSIERELGGRALPPWNELCDRLHEAVEESLERKLERVAPESLGACRGRSAG
jgi:lipoyl(octanoyl) transferase